MFGVFLSCSNISVHHCVQSSRCSSANHECMWGIRFIQGEKSSVSRPGRFNPRGEGGWVDPTGRLDTSENRNTPFSCYDWKKKNSLVCTSRHSTGRVATVKRFFLKMPHHCGHLIASRYVTVVWKMLRCTEYSTK